MKFETGLTYIRVNRVIKRRGKYWTQRRKTERRHSRQIAIASFLLGFIFTLVYLGRPVKASPVVVSNSLGVIKQESLGQVATAGKYKPPERLALRIEIEQYILHKFGKDGKKALAIAYCESGLNTEAINLNGGKSLDRGIFQLNTVHNHITSECAFNAKCNIDAAYNLYLKQGFNPWVCAKKI